MPNVQVCGKELIRALDNLGKLCSHKASRDPASFSNGLGNLVVLRLVSSPLKSRTELYVTGFGPYIWAEEHVATTSGVLEDLPTVAVMHLNPEKTEIVDDLDKIKKQVKANAGKVNDMVNITFNPGTSIMFESGTEFLGELPDTYGDGPQKCVDIFNECMENATGEMFSPFMFEPDVMASFKGLKGVVVKSDESKAGKLKAHTVTQVDMSATTREASQPIAVFKCGETLSGVVSLVDRMVWSEGKYSPGSKEGMF